MLSTSHNRSCPFYWANGLGRYRKLSLVCLGWLSEVSSVLVTQTNKFLKSLNFTLPPCQQLTHWWDSHLFHSHFFNRITTICYQSKLSAIKIFWGKKTPHLLKKGSWKWASETDGVKCYIQEEWVSLDTIHVEAGEGVSWKQTSDAVLFPPGCVLPPGQCWEGTVWKTKRKSTKQLVGVNGGVLVPDRAMLIGPATWVPSCVSGPRDLSFFFF